MNKKIKTARLSIFSNLFLLTIKIFAGVVSGSVSILSEAIHSSIDLIASAIAYFAVKISSKAPDDKHPYGHGKFENVSGVVEGLLIFVAAIWIIYEAIHKIIEPTEISYFLLAGSVMFISALVNFFVSRRLYQVAKETDSIALEADALHLKTDIYSSIGVGIGMLLIYLTGWYIFDPIFAILVALLIMKESYTLVANAFSPLIDSQLNEEEYNQLKKRIETLTSKLALNFSQLRSRKSGSKHLIDFNLCVPPLMTVQQSHEICDYLEEEIMKDFLDAEVHIHVEPLKAHPALSNSD
jgi:cation diffusion facilitator family transporter